MSSSTLRRSARISTTAPENTTVKTETSLIGKKPTTTKKKSTTTTKPRATSTTNKRKAIPPSSPPPKDEEQPPSTPLPKKQKRPSKKPSTITPSAIALLSTSTSTSALPPTSALTSHPLEILASLTPRPASPHATNAPLATSISTSPKNSQILTSTTSTTTAPTPSPSKRKKDAPPPDVGSASLPHPSSTIDTLLDDACSHLVAVDPKLEVLIGKHHCKMFSPEGLREVVDPFTALASGIIGQQVSGQAAASIRKKFTALFPTTHPSFPTPAQIIEKDLPTLRTAGLSQRKAEYIHGLAEKFASGELSAQMLISASDEDLIEKLVAVRGLGRWSVEMFACFGLKRMDVFSTGDLGVQRGMATYIGKDVSKLKNKGGKWKYMTEKEMLDGAARFSPYRSLFMWYMWRISDVDVSVLQD